MSEENSVRRTTITVDSELAAKLDTYVDWGIKSAVYTKLTKLLLDLVKKHDKKAIFYLLAGKVSLKIEGVDE